jgi:uncharacterized protein YcfJ
MVKQIHKRSLAFTFIGPFLSACSSPLTTREQGGLIGAGLGAGSGALIGTTIGHASGGALIGGPLGLLAGVLIGDQLMSYQRAQGKEQRRIDKNAAKLERRSREKSDELYRAT